MSVPLRASSGSAYLLDRLGPGLQRGAPHFNGLAALYEPGGVRVLGINIQDSKHKSRNQRFWIQHSVARDADASVAMLYEVTATPTVIFSDREGTLLAEKA
ncbi:MAG: hypothetical protein ACR2IB_12090 [Pyrinomonadaceae bacterium]